MRKTNPKWAFYLPALNAQTSSLTIAGEAGGLADAHAVIADPSVNLLLLSATALR
jgi:hypothetical protein